MLKKIDLRRYTSEFTNITPTTVKNNKLYLSMIDQSYFSEAVNSTYLEYDIDSERMIPITTYQDISNGLIKVIQTEISNDLLYHAILKSSHIDYDIIEIYKLGIENNGTNKIYEFQINKGEAYRHFGELPVGHIYLFGLSENQMIIRLSNSNGVINYCDRKYIYKNLSTGFTKEISANQFVLELLWYVGIVTDGNEDFFVFSMGDGQSAGDKQFAKLYGFEYDDTILDRIIMIKKDDFEDEISKASMNFITIDHADNQTSIEKIVIMNNEICYMKTNISNENETEFFIYNVKDKDHKSIKKNEVVEYSENNYYFIYNHENNIIVKDGWNKTLLEINNNNEEQIFQILSNKYVITELNNNFSKKIYELGTNKLIDTVEGYKFFYFETDDLLVIC